MSVIFCQENDGTEFILVRPECGKAVCGQDGEVVAFQQGAATGAGNPETRGAFVNAISAILDDLKNNEKSNPTNE